MEKDWKGDYNGIWMTLGASNHTDKERHTDDYYATDPIAAELLLEVETFSPNIWECASGTDHLANVFRQHGYNVRTTDIVKRLETTEQLDFLNAPDTVWNGDIITNPPYSKAQEFVEKALSLVTDGHKVCMFLKTVFLEGKKRRELYEKYPPKTIYVSSSRIMCAKNGEFERMKAGGGSAVSYSWFVWEKGYQGETVVKWIN